MPAVSDAAVLAEHRSAGARLRDLRPAWLGLAAFLIYLILTCLVWLPPIGGAIASRYVGDGWADARLYRWGLQWTPWALLHGHSPLFAANVFAPDGVDLTWVTFMPSVGIASYPLQRLAGSLVTLNVLMLLAPALAAWATYLVCHRVTHRFWPSLLGGVFLGWSSFIAGHMVDHLNLVMIFPVPLAMYLVIRRVEGSLARVAFVGLLALDLVFLFGVSTELFATATLFGAIAFVLALAFAGRDVGRVAHAAVLVVSSYAIVGVLLLPFVTDALDHQPTGVLRPVDKTSIDLASWIVPREHQRFGGDRFTSVTSRFTANSQEDAGYVGIAALVMLVGFVVTDWRRRSTWALLAFLAIVAVLASGPVMHIVGETSVTLPGKLLTEVPLLQHATPQRFPVYAALALGVIAAMWVSRASGATAWIRWGVAGVAALALLPAPDPSVFHAYGATPGFFTSGDVQQQIHEGETVFAITERPGTELEWLAASDFWYRIPQGYIGPVPAAYEGQPLYRGLASVQLNPYIPTPEDFATWLTETGTTAALLDDDAAWKFGPLLSSVGLEQVHRGDGVSVWRPGPHGYVVNDPAAVVLSGDIDHVGGELRAFSFPSLTGGDRITGPIEGPTLFSFVGPDCGSCEEHLRALDAFAAAHPDVRVIVVSSWDPTLANAELIRSLGLGVEVAQDPLGRMATAANGTTLPILVPPTPFSILVGADGSVDAVFRGVWSERTPAPIASYTGP
jgi:thiol-disulfide isomerase/thioredoxin